MDCADLYMTQSIWRAIKESDSIFIIAIKGFDYIEPIGVDICLVKYTKDEIKLERLLG